MLGSKWCPSKRLSAGEKLTLTHLPAQVSRVVLQECDPTRSGLKSAVPSKKSRNHAVASEALIGVSSQQACFSE